MFFILNSVFAVKGIVRLTLQEPALANFDGFVAGAFAREVQEEKNKNILPETAGRKQYKNPLEEEARANQEIKSKRTLNSRTYKVGEGKYKTEVYQEPVHYRNEKNQLMDIDNTLVASKEKGYAFENRANTLKVRFTEKAGERRLGQIQQREFSLSWAALNGQEVRGATAGNTITYRGIDENVDLRYTMEGSRLKEELVLLGAGYLYFTPLSYNDFEDD